MLDGLAAFIGANFSASEALSAPEAEEEEERASQRGKKGSGEFAKLSKSLSEEQLKAELSMEDAAAVEVVQSVLQLQVYLLSLWEKGFATAAEPDENDAREAEG